MTANDVAWLDETEMAAWVGLIKLASRIVTLSDGELRRTRGITGRDYELLHHLSVSPEGWRVNELAEVIDDTSSCITHRINRLQTAGLVEKRADVDDQRARRVRLTRAGRSLLERAAPEHVARVRQWVIDPLDRRDLADLARLAAMLNAHLRGATGGQSESN
jgi:DNA-binding MarR family transcriptional regulator